MSAERQMPKKKEQRDCDDEIWAGCVKMMSVKPDMGVGPESDNIGHDAETETDGTDDFVPALASGDHAE